VSLGNGWLVCCRSWPRVLEIGMWWLVISRWKQSQPQSIQQEAKRKQKALVILASARRIEFDMNHQSCSTTKQPNLFDYQTTELVWHCHHLPLPRQVYIAGHFSLISLSPLMYQFTFMQATLIHLHNMTRSALVTHHYYCLSTSSNQPWWI
jgi:hypothetical protein